MPKEVTDPELLKQLNAPPKEVSDPDTLRQLHEPEPESRTWQFVRGAGRGLAGLVQSAGEILPDPMDMVRGKDDLPDYAKKARKDAEQQLHKFTDAPSASGWETAGRLTGQIAPFAFMPGFGATSTLGSIAERAAIGGVAGGLQPTKEHTAESHLLPAVAGAGTAGAARAITSAAIPAAQKLSGHPVGQKVLELAVRGGLEYPIAKGLEAAGFSPKEAHVAALMVVTLGGLRGSGKGVAAAAPRAAPDVINLPGSFAARFGGAAAGEVAEAARDKFGKKSNDARSPAGE